MSKNKRYTRRLQKWLLVETEAVARQLAYGIRPDMQRSDGSLTWSDDDIRHAVSERDRLRARAEPDRLSERAKLFFGVSSTEIKSTLDPDCEYL